MKKVILLLLILLPFVTKAQVRSDCYSAKITYKNDSISVKYRDQISKSNISYEYKYFGIKSDLIKDDRNIVLIVNCSNLPSRNFLLKRNKDTIINVLFEEIIYGENLRKPIIYLYPIEEKMIDVKVNFKGEIKNTYPVYDKGWKVLAEPDGTMINQKDQSKHRYLFWDGVNEKNYSIDDFKTGFVVKGKNTAKFLDSILTLVGFSDFEKNDFISYWLPQMSLNEFNFVHFMINDECDNIATLNVNPKPDSEIRVYMFFEGIEKPFSVKKQEIKSIKRDGFVLVEWGGFENIKISGRVASADDGCFLPGVAVLIQGTNIIAVTDMNGYFNLELRYDIIPEKIIFSLMGMETKTVPYEKFKNNPIIYLSKKQEDLDHTVITVKKPVIYLYPQAESLIDVKVNFKGEIKNTYPVYDKGWKVLAEPDGTMINQKDKTKHRYLFWDGVNEKNYQIADFKTGFVVKGKNTADFLNSVLTKLGFTDFEKNDFISYWLPQMSSNSYNFIHFMINDECDNIATLNVNPKPDSEIRVYMFFEGIEKLFSVKKQEIKSIKRDGFVLIEWGGIELSDDFKVK